MDYIFKVPIEYLLHEKALFWIQNLYACPIGVVKINY